MVGIAVHFLCYEIRVLFTLLLGRWRALSEK